MTILGKFLAYILILTLFTSCQGFKVLTIHNTSSSDAVVTVRPGMQYSDKTQIHDFPNLLTVDSSVFVLQPDSSMKILSIFTGMMFNVKIQESDLRTDYLKIETKTDTIVPKSKREILDLLKDEKTRYRRKTDKGKGIANW